MNSPVEYIDIITLSFIGTMTLFVLFTGAAYSVRCEENDDEEDDEDDKDVLDALGYSHSSYFYNQERM